MVPSSITRHGTLPLGFTFMNCVRRGSGEVRRF